MIKALVFSKDRAFQLQATLESIFLHCMDVDSIHISVLFACSSTRHAHQYQQLIENWKSKQTVTFVPQVNFRSDALNILNPYPENCNLRKFFGVFSKLDYRFSRLLCHLPFPRVNGAFILFLVDDALFVSDFRLADLINELHKNPDTLGFSLRLGRNTTQCYMVNAEQRLPVFSTSSNFALKFKWTDGELEFGYPLEVSSSLYRLNEIFSLAIIIPFKNPNELEGNMAARAKDFSNKQPFLLCPNRSLAFCNPVNVVQTTSVNRAGEIISYPSSQLADFFDKGYRLKVDAYNDFIPVSCHQEVALDLKQVVSRDLDE